MSRYAHTREPLAESLPVTLTVPAAGPALRLLFLNHNVVRAGGTYYRAFDAARHLVRRGHSVTLLSISPKSRFRIEREIVEGVEIVHTPDLFWGIGRSGWDPWDVLVRTKFVREGEWDIVHAWDCRPAVILPAIAARLGRKERTKLVIDWCDWWGRGGTQLERGGSWVRYIYNAVETFFEESFRRVGDATTVISTALWERAVRLGVPLPEIRFIPQGCDVPPQDRMTRAEARASLGLDPDAAVFITVGVLNTSDAALLFKTVPLVRARIPSAKFFIIGRNRARVPDHLAGDAVDDLGFVPDETLFAYLSAADALVVPLAETVASRGRWPSKVNSALIQGLPVVLTRVGDLPQILERAGAAFISPARPEPLAETIVSAVADEHRAARIKDAARSIANDILPWNKVIDELEACYFEVLSKSEKRHN